MGPNDMLICLQHVYSGLETRKGDALSVFAGNMGVTPRSRLLKNADTNEEIIILLL